MKDNYGREIDYLRVSVTKRCNLNCSYCGSVCTKDGELTKEEILKVTALFAENGIKKVRLTGGEPLIRSDIAEIAQGIKNIPGIEELGITTNGVLFSEYAQSLKNAGVDYINISLDTLDKDMYKKLTGSDALEKVLSGIKTALELGFREVKINAVPIRDVNDSEAEKLIMLAKDYPLDVRFIELMPFSDAGENKKLLVTADEILKRFPFLTPLPRKNGSAAVYYKAEGFKGKIGMITAVSHKFCSSCSRMRLLSDGKIKPCLGQELTYDIRPYLNDPDKLNEIIIKAIKEKPAGHSFGDEPNAHGLNLIGG